MAYIVCRPSESLGNLDFGMVRWRAVVGRAAEAIPHSCQLNNYDNFQSKIVLPIMKWLPCNIEMAQVSN